MNPLVKAEFCKLTSTRLWLWMLILGPALVVGTTTLAIGFAEPGPLGLDTAAGQRIVFAQATADLGCRRSPRHHRSHRRVRAPDRHLDVPGDAATLTVVQAKFLTYAPSASPMRRCARSILLAVALPWLAAENVHVVLSRTDIARTMGGVGIEVGLYAVLGVAIGCLMRNQIAAIVGLSSTSSSRDRSSAMWHAISEVTKYSPYQAGNALGQLTASVDVRCWARSPAGSSCWRGCSSSPSSASASRYAATSPSPAKY